MIIKRFVCVVLSLIFIILCALNAFAQLIPEMEFNNVEITDIFLALSNAVNISIIPDDTIKGTATYFFVEMEFEKALEIDPKDGPSKTYVGRCNTFLEEPPEEDWDGVYTHTEKG